MDHASTTHSFPPHTKTTQRLLDFRRVAKELWPFLFALRLRAWRFDGHGLSSGFWDRGTAHATTSSYRELLANRVIGAAAVVASIITSLHKGCRPISTL